MISHETIEILRNKASLLDILGEYTEVKKQGNRVVACCPFHSERTPSFFVRDEGKFYHCFGCGASGNVFSFLMNIKGISFPDAVEELAHRYNVQIKHLKTFHGAEDPNQIKRSLFKINQLAQDFFIESAKSPDKEVLDYIKQRGLNPFTIKEFSLGFAPLKHNSLLSFLRSKNISDETALKAGLVRRNSSGEIYDTFRNRLMFPIWFDSRRIAGFGGRVIPSPADRDSKTTIPKYINSPESPIYHKSKILFGLPQALMALREKGSIYIVEGYLDVISMWQVGVKNVVATCGTALTVDHLSKVSRLVRSVILLFDGDIAGRAAAARAFETSLNARVEIYALFLPEGEDPDTIAKKNQAKTADFLNALPKIPLLDCFIENVAISIGGGNVKELGDIQTGNVAERIIETLSKVSDPIVRDRLMQSAANKLRVNPELLRVKLGGEVKHNVVNQTFSSVDIKKLSRVEQEIILSAMVLRETIPSRILEDPDITQSLSPITIEFLSGLRECVVTDASKERILGLLKTFGQSWVLHWKKAYEMAKETNLELLFEDCRKRLEETRLRSRFEALKNEIRSARDEEERACLFNEQLGIIKMLKSTENQD